MSTFRELIPPFFADLFRANPVLATTLGNHDHDGEWPDLSPAGTASRRAILDRWEEAFAALPEAELDPDESVDREIVVGELAAYRFAESVLCEEAWDPLSTVYMVGSGIYSLLAREFAPLGVRLAAAAGRIEGIPRLMAAASGRLTGLPGRPVSRLHLETALRHLPGDRGALRRGTRGRSARTTDGELSAVRARLESGLAAGRRALDRFARHLTGVGASGVGRRGPAGPGAVRRQAAPHAPGRADAGDLEDAARREFDAVRAEMIRLAASCGRPVPAPEAARLTTTARQRRARPIVAAEHQPPATLLELLPGGARPGSRPSAGERDVIGLPTEPAR